MDSQKYLFGAAAVGMAIAVVLIFNEPGSAGSSSDNIGMASFSVDAQASDAGTENSIMASSVSESANMEHAVLDRQVRVIYPSPYEGVSRSGGAIDQH